MQTWYASAYIHTFTFRAVTDPLTNEKSIIILLQLHWYQTRTNSNVCEWVHCKYFGPRNYSYRLYIVLLITVVSPQILESKLDIMLSFLSIKNRIRKRLQGHHKGYVITVVFYSISKTHYIFENYYELFVICFPWSRNPLLWKLVCEITYLCTNWSSTRKIFFTVSWSCSLSFRVNLIGYLGCNMNS